MKRLLFVSYYYPPLAGPGVFRPLRLSKYLPGCGWEVTVLTAGERTRVLRDPGLVAEVPTGVRVERTRSLEPRMPLLALRKLGLKGLAVRIEPWFYLPDDQRGWVPFACRRAASLLREQEHHAVVTTSAPYSAHLVGLRLQRRFGIPWVADFRDEWTTNPYIRYPSGWHRRLNERLEREILTAADRVVCVSEPWLANMAAQVPQLPHDKFRALPNGFDADHFPETAPPPDRFRVVYTGAFYGPRSPSVFLEALGLVRERGGIPAGELEVVFVGHTGNANGLASLADRGVRVVEQQPYRVALDYLRQAALLLLVIPPEGGAGNHTGKLFNYLASGRPILALAPTPNVAADLIVGTRSGRVVSPTDPVGVAEALEALYGEWKRGASPTQDRQGIAAYEARPQAAAWARLLTDLTE